MHTAPPLPLFIHCAHDSPHPPLVTPDQLRDAGAAASQLPVEGLPNSWMTGAGGGASPCDPLPLPKEMDSPPLVTAKRIEGWGRVCVPACSDVKR